jgi:hypothetical protein
MVGMMKTGSDSVTVRMLLNGETIMESGSPWFRLFRSLADLYISGEISTEELEDHETQWTGRIIPDLPAARLLQLIGLALIEPSCMCVANWEAPPCLKGCEPMDRRARLAELIGD